jgi:signal transduction histidine kinase
MVATLINAAEALGDNPEGRITVRTRREDDEMSVCVSVSDNGPGMSEEVKQRIFDPFYTTKDRSVGTGLGLSVTYGIIQEHGGRIEVESKKREGTTFTFHLPRHRRAE